MDRKFCKSTKVTEKKTRLPWYLETDDRQENMHRKVDPSEYGAIVETLKVKIRDEATWLPQN